MGEYVLMHKESGHLCVGLIIGDGPRYLLSGDTPGWYLGAFKFVEVWMVYDSEYHAVYFGAPDVKALFENLGEL